MKKYKHLLFDLDHTLWDYDRNAFESLSDLYHQFDLKSLGIPSADDFFSTFKRENGALWKLHNVNLIDKAGIRANRFPNIFKAYEIDVRAVPGDLEQAFNQLTPAKQHLLPGAIEILDYLKSSYALHIITNGFEDTQYTKLTASGISNYFDVVVTSESSGFTKPDKRIFDFTLKQLKTQPTECLMIGDNADTDILGAINAAIDQVWFNPHQQIVDIKATFEIKALEELKLVL